ncbi:hypothetical protein LSUE1_G007644 [Lachnellula suecica]|uniref:BTB domain-containing protein n=1 Tax=Lachnellula suecica TaxID=602035 RepID=A0A8T9CGY3_9HELO|nr:hypothetical protein LSUE1_G007644 [Lachnellula suecica]
MADAKQSTQIVKAPAADAKTETAPESKAPDFSNADEFVTILAGKNAKKFLVHKEFACHYSPVFKAAFNSEFIEGKTGMYKLDDVDPEAVKLLVRWMYTKKLTITVDDIETEKTEEEIETFELFEELAVKLWILAERLLMPALQNQTIDWLWKKLGVGRTQLTILETIYEQTSAGSALRRYAVAQCAFNFSGSMSSYVSLQVLFPVPMLLELLDYLGSSKAMPPFDTFYVKMHMSGFIPVPPKEKTPTEHKDGNKTKDGAMDADLPR